MPMTVQPVLSLFRTLLLAALSALFATAPALAQSCSFDGQLQTDPETLANSGPVQGPPDAELLLIEFFDPNCPHCQRFHPVMQQVMETYGEQVRYYKKPLPLGDYSIDQIRAILIAQQRGKYYDMVEAQLESPHAGRGGMTRNQLVHLGEEIGLDPDWFRGQLADSSKMRMEVRRLTFEARKAGIQSIPTLAIGRKAVIGPRSAECINRLIEQKLGGEPEAPSSKNQ